MADKSLILLGVLGEITAEIAEVAEIGWAETSAFFAGSAVGSEGIPQRAWRQGWLTNMGLCDAM